MNRECIIRGPATAPSPPDAAKTQPKPEKTCRNKMKNPIVITAPLKKSLDMHFQKLGERDRPFLSRLTSAWKKT